MFEIISISDTVRVEPKWFNKDLERIKKVVKAKYVEKIIPNYGLGVAFYDFIKIGDAQNYAGSDGSYFTKVDFRLVVFCPFEGEIFIGTIKNCLTQGIQLSVDFFDNIFIPPNQLKDPSRFEDETNTWYWDFQGHPLALNTGSKVRCKVIEVQFSVPAGQDYKQIKEPDNSQSRPMMILCALDDDGLGDVNWEWG